MFSDSYPVNVSRNIYTLNNCGDFSKEVTEDGFIQSPGYPNNYPNLMECTKLIRGENPYYETPRSQLMLGPVFKGLCMIRVVRDSTLEHLDGIALGNVWTVLQLGTFGRYRNRERLDSIALGNVWPGSHWECLDGIAPGNIWTVTQPEHLDGIATGNIWTGSQAGTFGWYRTQGTHPGRFGPRTHTGLFGPGPHPGPFGPGWHSGPFSLDGMACKTIRVT